jgi:hypothetical protein
MKDPGRRLGHPEPLLQRDAAVHPRLRHPRGHRRSAVLDDAQRRQVGARERGVLAHHLQHRRHAGEAGDAGLADAVQDRTGVDLRHGLDASALEQRGQRDLPDPDAVEQRCDAQGPVGGQHVDVRELVDSIPGQVAVGEQRALGTAGGAGGVEQQRGIVEADDGRLAQARARRDRALVVGPDLQPRAAEGRHGVRAGHEERGARVVEHEADLGAGQAVVERHRDRAEAPHREERLQHLDAVDAQLRDAVAGTDTRRGQGTREPVDALRQLTVGHRAAWADERRTVGGDPGPAGGPAAEAVGTWCHAPHSCRTIDAGNR